MFEFRKSISCCSACTKQMRRAALSRRHGRSPSTSEASDDDDGISSTHNSISYTIYLLPSWLWCVFSFKENLHRCSTGSKNKAWVIPSSTIQLLSNNFSDCLDKIPHHYLCNIFATSFNITQQFYLVVMNCSSYFGLWPMWHFITGIDV